MTANWRLVAILLAWLASVAEANYAGGVAGFTQGQATQLALSGTDALHTMTLLRELRAGKTTEAISILEIHLDGQLAQNVFGQDSYRSPYNVLQFIFPEIPTGNSWALSQILKYRFEHPPVGPNAAVNAKLMGGLAKYGSAPRPDMSGQPRSIGQLLGVALVVALGDKWVGTFILLTLAGVGVWLTTKTPEGASPSKSQPPVAANPGSDKGKS